MEANMIHDVNEICNRLLDSEEHAVESAVPPVAEDAVEVIRDLAADALRFRKLMMLLQKFCDNNARYARLTVPDGLSLRYCTSSNHHDDQTVKLEIAWNNKHGANPDLASALDGISIENFSKKNSPIRP